MTLDALPLHDFVWDRIYPEIAKRHEDEEGSYGYGFVNNQVKKLCYKITHPRRLLEVRNRVLKQITARRNSLAPSNALVPPKVDELIDKAFVDSIVDLIIESDWDMS